MQTMNFKRKTEVVLLGIHFPPGEGVGDDPDAYEVVPGTPRGDRHGGESAERWIGRNAQI